MIEFDSIATVLRRTSHLYWLFAIVAIVLAVWFGKTWRAKTLWAVVAIALFGFIPARGAVEQSKRDAYAREAWAYFKKKCETEAGEKIYKTYTAVRSVLVIKPLPPASDKDNFDQFWYGDPYSASAGPYRSQLASRFTRDRPNPNGPTRGYDFVELTIQSEQGTRYEHLSPLPADPQRENTKVPIEKPVSRFGVSWEDISSPQDRQFWVAGSRLRVIDLKDNSIVAERIGYFIEAGFGSKAGQRRPWLTSKGPRTTCPEAHDWADRWFVLRALRPSEEN